MTCRRRLTLVAMCIAQGMTLLDVTIVNTALPSIQRELHMTAGQLEWVISAYALSLAAFIPLGGALGDRYGRKRFFLAGMVVFTLGSVACALSTSDVALIGSRALQGAGGAFMSALTLAILTETYPVERRAGAFGMWAAISGLGFGLGPVVGGALLSVFSWSSVFWVNVPIAVVGFVIALVAVTESRNPEAPPARHSGDVRHRARAPRHHVRPHRVVEPCLGVVRRRHTAGARPGPRGVLRPVGEPDVVAHAAAQPVAGPQLRLGVWRLSPDLPGAGRGHVLRHPPLPGRGGVVAVPHRRVVVVDEHSVHRDRPVRRPAPPPLPARRDRGRRLSRSARGGVAVLTLLSDSTSFSLAFVGYVLVGIGWGTLVPGVVNVAMRDVPPGVSGGASGLVNAARQVGTSVGLAVLGTIQVPCGRDRLDQPHVRDFTEAVAQSQSVAGGQIDPVSHVLGTQYRPDAVAAFVSGYHLALLVAAGSTLLAAVVAAVGLRSGARAPVREPVVVPEVAVEGAE